MKRCFPPVIDGNTEILILGSFPGETSLQKKQYYGYPQNQFWKLIGEVIKEPLHEMPYSEKKRKLLANNIGVWDVIGKCEREGSSDTKIRNPVLNDLSKLKQKAPRLKMICCNGKTSARYVKRDVRVLPSSSPANTVAFKEKLREWEKALTLDNSA